MLIAGNHYLLTVSIINQGWFIPDDVCHKVARYLCKEEDDFTKTGCP